MQVLTFVACVFLIMLVFPVLLILFAKYVQWVCEVLG